MFKNNLKLISNMNMINRYNSIKSIENELKLVKKITGEDLDKFSELTGDKNILHSSELPPSERYVHGAFLNALVAGIIGTKFPGPGTIVVEQKFNFPHKCQINEDIEFLLKLVENRKIMKIDYECKQNNKIVFQGNAKLVRIRT